MRKSVFLVVLFLGFSSSAFADVLTENFNSVASLPGSGWVTSYNSSPIGTTGWFQGNTGVFSAQSGPADSYIAANFLNADVNGGNISTWLITPELDLSSALIFSFFTRTETGVPFADNLEVRLSTNGASTDVGATDSSVGDFTTLLLTINPSLDPNGYPQDWTQFALAISSLGTGAQGRLAFRYVVPDTSVNGDYIGIDSVNVASVPTPEPATFTLLFFGIGAMASRTLVRRRKQSSF